MEYKIEHFNETIQCNFSSHPPPSCLHIHDLLEVVFFLDGDVNFFVDGQSWLLQRGTMLFINKNVIHGPRQLTNKTYRRATIHFPLELARKLSSGEGNLLAMFESGETMIRLTEEQIPKMKVILRQLTDEYLTPSAIGHQPLLHANLIQLLIYAQNCRYNRGTEVKQAFLPPLINDSLDYIQANLVKSDLSLKKIASALAYNDIYLNRLFKKEIGNTIHQYILLCRISLAKKLLQRGYDVQQCCDLCGFNNYSNFIRTFKKVTQITPKQYSLTYKRIEQFPSNKTDSNGGHL